jgi:hypothetical protein
LGCQASDDDDDDDVGVCVWLIRQVLDWTIWFTDTLHTVLWTTGNTTLLLFPHFTVHRYTCTRILSLHWGYSNSIESTEDIQMHQDYYVCVLVRCVLLVTVYVWICIVCTLFCIVPFMYSLIALSVSV